MATKFGDCVRQGLRFAVCNDPTKAGFPISQFQSKKEADLASETLSRLT